MSRIKTAQQLDEQDAELEALRVDFRRTNGNLHL